MYKITGNHTISELYIDNTIAPVERKEMTYYTPKPRHCDLIQTKSTQKHTAPYMTFVNMGNFKTTTNEQIISKSKAYIGYNIPKKNR